MLGDLHVSSPRGQGTKSGGEEHANVSNVHRQVQCVEDVVDDTARGH